MDESLTKTSTGVKVACTICGTIIPIEFGELTKTEALEAIAKLDGPRECPGFHVELSGFRKWWRLDEAVELFYGRR